MNILDIVKNAQDIRDLAGKALSDAAKNLNIPGRSKMKADEIREALSALLIEATPEDGYESPIAVVETTTTETLPAFEFPNGEVSPAIEIKVPTETSPLADAQIHAYAFTPDEIYAEMRRRGPVFNTGAPIKAPLAQRGKNSARVLAERSRRKARR